MTNYTCNNQNVVNLEQNCSNEGDSWVFHWCCYHILTSWIENLEKFHILQEFKDWTKNNIPVKLRQSREGTTAKVYFVKEGSTPGMCSIQELQCTYCILLPWQQQTTLYLWWKCANQVITLRQHLNIKQNSMKWWVCVTGTKPRWFGNFLITNKFIVFVPRKG